MCYTYIVRHRVRERMNVRGELNLHITSIRAIFKGVFQNRRAYRARNSEAG